MNDRAPAWSDLLAADIAGEQRNRAETLAAVKRALTDIETDLRRRFEAREIRADSLMPARARLYDGLIADLLTHASEHKFPAADPSKGELPTVAAVGGYGRGELAPHSDIDLLFLQPVRDFARGERIVEYVLYMLWDLGLKVGQAVRTPEECLRMAKDNQAVATALLEARWLWGDVELYEGMRNGFWDKSLGNSPIWYVDAKLAERDERHEKLGDTRYVLEPNIKDGKGGLRDLHTLYWIAKALYRVESMDELGARGVFTAGEVRRFRKGEAFLSDVRCYLHYLTGRPEERLTFEHQHALAEPIGYRPRNRVRAVERFMKHYFTVAKDVGDLTRILCAALEVEHKRPGRFPPARLPSFEKKLGDFTLSHDRLNVRQPTAFRDDPLNLLRLFRLAQEHDVDIHPEALYLVRRDLRRIDRVRDTAEANELFLTMLTASSGTIVTLHRLNEVGLFGRFLPPFGFVVAMMQYNTYHSYTVDEHIIRAIAELRRLENGDLRNVAPVASEMMRQVPQRRALYIAVLFHDIGKGRGGDHSIIGAELLEEYGPRLGLTPAETETAVWLVRHHLVMSDTAQRRDPNDPKTIQDFCQIVQSPDRLRQLLVLTVCDIRAVGPDVWTNWKAALLRDLYWRADEVLTGNGDVASLPYRAAARRAELAEALADWPAAARAAHLDRAPDTYWVAWPVADLAAHANLLREAMAADPPIRIAFGKDDEGDATIVTVCTRDEPGLFAKLTDALALAGADIVGARAFTLHNGFVIDGFWVQGPDGGAEVKESRIQESIRMVLKGDIAVRERLQRPPTWPHRTAVFNVEPRVIIDNEASRYFTVIEVNGHDRPGFLNMVAWTMHRSGLRIASSHIATYGERAVDVFYVKDLFGLKVEHAGKIERIEKALTEAIRESNALVSGEAATAAG